ncbi:MAG: MFS transporter [Gammaproteobacteria bacterium RIFCSPHIGHO2_12_FULL_45_9]|nr:MAG: MFS transporter [Gammaproteobacteria bacterium RIFCSPHIGHO2_12_FULL_45_9]
MLKRTATYMPWLVCLSAALFFFFIFIQMNLFNAIAPALMQDFQVSAAVIGHLSAQYFYANILCAVPAGLLLDRYSTRRLLIVAMAVTIGCTYGFALSHAVWQAGLFRFVTGMMGSFCLLSCVRLAARWFKPERMALVIGIVVALAMLGGTVAQTPMTLLTDTVGWRAALMWDATSGLVLLGWIIWAVRDFPPRMAQTVLAEQAAVHEAGLWRSLQGMAKNRQNWLGGLYTSLLNLPIFLLGAMWGSLYLVQIHHLTREEASWVTSMIFVGTIIGSSCVGWISDTLRRRRLPMLVGAVVSLVVILAIIYTPHLSLGMLLTGFLLLGIFTSTQIISYPLIAESNPAANVGSAEGLASILILTGGFTQPLFAWLMGLHWNHQIVLGVPVYTFSNYELGLLIMPIAFVLGLVCALCVRETYCRAYQSAPHA